VLNTPEEGNTGNLDTANLHVSIQYASGQFDNPSGAAGKPLLIGGTTLTLLHNTDRTSNLTRTFRDDTTLDTNVRPLYGFPMCKLDNLQFRGFIHSADRNSLHIEATVRVQKSAVVLHTVGYIGG